MSKIGKFIEAIADAVKELVRDERDLDGDAPGRIPPGFLRMHGIEPMNDSPPPSLVKSVLPLPMVSTNRDWSRRKIKPGETIEVIARPLFCAFRPEAFHMEQGHPDRWKVSDIRVGNRSQMVTSGAVPGEVLFSSGFQVQLETCQTTMDFVLVVTYEGNEPDGEVFECTVTGSVAH